MLQGNFFTITSIETDTSAAKAVIRINPEHEIFVGHFPGTPVVPGVCMMQIVKEILEDVLAINIKLIKADHIKFLTVINPLQTSTVQLDLKYTITESGDVITVASLLDDKAVYFKFKGLFRPA
ncbi:MAG TPA: hypothetical protein VNV85_16090 [Puia sp.]|jgi:3-hydroxyacyl-[acyl-carrier-protein] dehydratase|nr:hypothetical protein [Puia sp.]